MNPDIMQIVLALLQQDPSIAAELLETQKKVPGFRSKAKPFSYYQGMPWTEDFQRRFPFLVKPEEEKVQTWNV